MKEKYVTPEMEILTFAVKDVITTSLDLEQKEDMTPWA